MTVIFGPWVLPAPWTVPRAHALRVLALCPYHGCRVGSRTEELPDARYGGIVNGQALWWLRTQGLAERFNYGGWGGPRRFTLTEKGKQLVKDLGGVK